MTDQVRQDTEERIQTLRTENQDDRAFVDALIQESENAETLDERLTSRYGEEALQLSREIGYERGEALGLLTLAMVHFVRQKHRESFALALESLPLLEGLGEAEPQAKCLTILSGLHHTWGNEQKALEHGYDAISRLEVTANGRWTGWSHYILGDVHRATGDLERAREHYSLTLEVFKELGVTTGVARAYIGLGNVCRMVDDVEQSRKHFEDAISLFEEIDDGIGIARALSDLALLSQMEGDLGQARSLLEQSLTIRRERASKLAIATCLVDIAKLLLLLEEADLAIARGSEALQIAQEEEHKPRQHACYQVLSDAYAAKGDLDAALTHYRAYQRIKEDVMSTDTMARLANLEISLEAAAAQKEAEMARKHNGELQEKNNDLARLLEELKDAQEMLIQNEKMASLGQLTAGIAHEIKNPLNFVNNFSVMTKDLAAELADEIGEHRQATVASVEKDFLELTGEIIANAERILEHGQRAGQIVNSMLVHTRHSSGKKTDVDVNELVESCVELAYHGFAANNDGFEAVIAKDFSRDVGTFAIIEDEFARVLTNILNNAFYATYVEAQANGDGYEPLVRVETSVREGVVEIVISDNGPGIPDEKKNKVFEPFFTTKPTGTGTGLGLSQSYEIVTKRHGGILRLTDAPGGGAMFVVEIPVG